jgi:hypothetical protein
MKRSLLVFAVAAVCAGLSLTSYAVCTPPTSPGAVICFPSANSTFTYPMNVEAAAKGANDSPIVKMILYSDNQKIDETTNYDTLTNASEMAVQYNGKHHLVLNAWDAAGKLYQASEEVTMVGGAVAQCTAPQTGIAICAPLNGSYWPESAVEVVASGSSAITGYDMWVNGKFFTSITGKNVDLGTGFWPVTDKPLTLTMKAKDTSGKTYTQTTQFYQYYASYVCGRISCNPGIFVTSPADHADVESGFTLNAQVQYNTATITAMKAYLDSKVVATSTGPSINAPIAATPGTHLLTIQAWDTTGALYKNQQTVNVQ